jgi:predicted nucleic acid-binding protein
MTYEYYSVDKKQINKQQLNIRDKSDHNILGAAIASKCDVLVTGDKDYFEMKYDNIEILTPRQFLEKY